MSRAPDETNARRRNSWLSLWGLWVSLGSLACAVAANRLYFLSFHRSGEIHPFVAMTHGVIVGLFLIPVYLGAFIGIIWGFWMLCFLKGRRWFGIAAFVVSVAALQIAGLINKG